MLDKTKAGSTSIEVTTINVDSREVEHSWETPKHFKEDWFSDDCSAPQLDDILISATVCGSKVSGETFMDVVEYLEVITGYKLL